MDTIELFKQKTNYKMFDECCICIYVYPFQYLQIRRNKEFYSKADYILLDGMMLTTLFNLFKVSSNKRMSIDFSGIADNLFNHIIDNRKNLYVIGAKQDEIERFLVNIKERYPEINIIGFHHGYIKNDKNLYNEVIREIVSLDPDFLLCGMGSPLQENFLFDLRANGWTKTGYSCGGFIYQSSLKLNYYPKWVNILRLRWLYRGIYEPTALLKTARIPIFIFVFFYDLVKYKISLLSKKV